MKGPLARTARVSGAESKRATQRIIALGIGPFILVYA
jgi:hypothetical protein